MELLFQVLQDLDPSPIWNDYNDASNMLMFVIDLNFNFV